MSSKARAPPPPPPHTRSPLTLCPAVSRVPPPLGRTGEWVTVPHVPHAPQDLQAALAQGAGGAESSGEGQ